MEAKEVKFLRFLNAPKQLIVPIYQRNYSWKEKECSQLWRDIIRAGKSSDVYGHFIGSVVYVEKGLYQVSTLPKLLVIDGQQRLTTLSLLIAALCNHLKTMPADAELNPKKLSSYYLLNENEDGEERYKVVLTRNDKSALFKVMDGIKLDQEDSIRIRENYEFFIDQLKTVDINVLHEGISKLIIIDVSLDREKDNPQLIFESLNSTGLELTHADLIRNYVLMKLDKEHQEQVYTKFWHPMERLFGSQQKMGVSDWFIRDYLTVKTGRIPKIARVYDDFKTFSSSKNVDIILEDMLKFAKHYVNFVLDKEPDTDLKVAFQNINALKVDVSYPFLLQVYDDYTNNIITRQEFLIILQLIESYVFRRAICEIPTNSLNKTFANLYKKIQKNQYVISLQAIILLLDSYWRLPDDSEFIHSIMEKDVYTFRNRNYLLSRLENYDRKEFVDVGGYTIEHIMPQNPHLSSEWQLELGEKWKDVQKKYLHTIGNLTLTGYNSELSDRPFKEKRNMKGGFADSPIRLNRTLALLHSWNENELIKRANELALLASKVWSYPVIEASVLDGFRKQEQPTTQQNYVVEDHMHLQEGEPMRKIFDELRIRLLNISAVVKEEPKKLYIAYKSSTNFVDIVAQKRALCLRMSIPFEIIKDPEERCTDISGKGAWGTGETELRIDTPNDIDYAIEMITQVFDYVEEQNGN